MNMREVSSEKPVAHLRRGYDKSGYSFHFVRCDSKKDLRDYMRAIPGIPEQPWFTAEDEDEIPYGAAAVIPEDMLPGLVSDSIGGFLVSCHMAVVADEDPKVEIRHWRHEIGHVCHLGRLHYREAFLRGMAAVRDPDDVNESDIETMTLGQHEFSAYCNEYLCEVIDNLLKGDNVTRAESGFGFLFPWLGLGGLK